MFSLVSAAFETPLRRLAWLIAEAPLNLVAAAERSSVYERHVLEAVAVGRLLTPAPGSRWLDLGTGGGLPGLALAVVYPDVSWTLVDATEKKIRAVASFADDLELHNVAAVHGRAERLAHENRFRGHFTGVVSRAVAPLPTLAELARGFLGEGGEVAAVKGPTWAQELIAAQTALRLLCLRFSTAHEVPEAVRATWLVTMRATGRPPVGYPRRDGLPRQQPLGRPTT